MKMRPFYLLILILFFFSSLHAQFFATGEEPGSIKWKQIETEHFKIVFPATFISSGKKLASYLEEVYKCGGSSLHHNPSKISIIVHSSSSISNGMVTWAPKRMEIYPVNNQDTYAQDWLQQLSIHEFRHVVQIDKLNVGFTKVLSFLFGQQATGAVVGLYLPPWFLEGDAVCTETALSQTGRGRMPSFSQGIKAQLMDKGIYSYEKATLGSYKSYVPNWYELGYQLVANGRARYGDEIWEQAISKSGRYSFSLNPFLRGIREVSGMNKRFYYQSIMDSLLQVWNLENSLLRPEVENYISNDSETYKNYLYPQEYRDKIVVQLESPDFTPRFVTLDSLGKEELLFEIGNRTDERFNVCNNMMVWAEYRPGLRFDHRNYSVIRCYDFEKKQISTLSHKSRYFAPQLNPSNPSLLCVEFLTNGSQQISVLDVVSGRKDSVVNVADNEEIISPVWIDNGHNIAAILLNNSGKRIAVYNSSNRKWDDLTSPSFNNITSLAVKDSVLFFTSNVSDQDNIFSIDRVTRKVRQLTRAKYGNTFCSSSSNGNILYSSYTANGYRVGKKVDTNSFQTVSDLGFQSSLSAVLSANEPIQPHFTLSDTLFQVKNYSRFHLLNFHSWGPYLNDGTTTYSGFSILSQNLLSNTFLTLGYNAEPGYGAEKYYMSLTYGGWVPKFNFVVKFGDVNMDYSRWYSVTSDQSQIVNVIAKDQQYTTSLEPSISLPLNLSKGTYFTRVIPSIGLLYQNFSAYNERQVFYQRSGPNQYISTGVTDVDRAQNDYISARYGLSFSSLKQVSNRDVWSRGGAALTLFYQQSPWSDLSKGTMLSVKGDILWRGFFQHDAFRASLIYEDKNPVYNGTTRTSYSNVFQVCRGYNNILSDQILTTKIDYQVPLLNPDATLSGAVYLKRIRVNFFYDYSYYKRFNATVASVGSFGASSFGADFWADFHVFQWITPLQMGYRIGYKPIAAENFYALLWSFNF